MLLAAWLWYKHAVGHGVGIAAIVLSLIFPPWIFPGAGLTVLTVATVIRRSRRLHHTHQREPNVTATLPDHYSSNTRSPRRSTR